jgi:hypothetical protein
MNVFTRRTLRVLLPVAAGLCVFASAAGALDLTVRSGNAAAGLPDPLIRRLDLATFCGVGSPTAFTAADFAAASGGPNAVVLSFLHPAWTTSLDCDPAAKWIGTAANANPLSALYAFDFVVPVPCCFTHATLDFCWITDDFLGDAINPAGIYVNGTPIAAVAGGNYAIQNSVSGIDVSSLLECGRNTVYIYNRDAGCAVSGVNFSSTLHLTDCGSVPVTPSTWGKVKSNYR